MHLPEYAQKNMVGILLMIVLFYFTKATLHKANLKNGIALIFVTVLMLTTHFGSTIALILYGLAILIASVMLQQSKKKLLSKLSAGLLLSTALFGVIRFFDVQRADRILYYLNHSFANSFVGTLIARDTQSMQKWMALAGILIPLALFIFLLKGYLNKRHTIPSPDQLFWLSHILFCYLLITTHL